MSWLEMPYYNNKTIRLLQPRDGESADEFHDRLEQHYGCCGCEDYGDNGCGCWRIGGYEFNGDGIEEDDSGWWACHREGRKEHYKELCEREKKGTLTFTAAIEAALKLMPEDESARAIYGDIVRSAAAVACHQVGDAHVEQGAR